jgi:hypothetical protein
VSLSGALSALGDGLTVHQALWPSSVHRSVRHEHPTDQLPASDKFKPDRRLRLERDQLRLQIQTTCLLLGDSVGPELFRDLLVHLFHELLTS